MSTMSKSKVALVKCDTYDCEQVIDAVETGVRLIGGISSFVKEGEKILVRVAADSVIPVYGYLAEATLARELITDLSINISNNQFI